MSPAAAAVLDRGVNILIGLTKPYIWIPFTASGLTPSQIFIYSDPSQYASTNIYTHLTIRQCEFYKDYSWQPNAFLERATIEDTTVTYALVNSLHLLRKTPQADGLHRADRLHYAHSG